MYLKQKMVSKRSKSVHLITNQRGIQQISWYKKLRYLGDRAITKLSLHTSSKNRNFLHLPIDLQRSLALPLLLKRYQGWKISVQGDNLGISIDKAMYHSSHIHYFTQV